MKSGTCFGSTPYRCRTSSGLMRVGPTVPSFLRDVQHGYIVVQFEAVGSLGTPPPPDAAWWGGFAVRQKICRGPTSGVGRQCVATALRWARIQAINN